MKFIPNIKFCFLSHAIIKVYKAGINKMFGSGHFTPIKEGQAGGKFFLGIFINYAYDYIKAYKVDQSARALNTKPPLHPKYYRVFGF